MSGIAHRHPLHVIDRFDQIDIAAERRIELPDGALDFRMSRMPYEEHFARLASKPRDFHVDLGHQRTGGVEDVQLAALRFHLNHAGHAVCTEDHGGAVGHFLEFLDEHRADGAQSINYILVVYDFVAHVDGRAE